MGWLNEKRLNAINYRSNVITCEFVLVLPRRFSIKKTKVMVVVNQALCDYSYR